jgi:hypothetical protein
MENKCSDRMAMPSVFGRSEDIVGNSIPGFKERPVGSWTPETVLDASGGFPQY